MLNIIMQKFKTPKQMAMDILFLEHLYEMLEAFFLF